MSLHTQQHEPDDHTHNSYGATGGALQGAEGAGQGPIRNKPRPMPPVLVAVVVVVVSVALGWGLFLTLDHDEDRAGPGATSPAATASTPEASESASARTSASPSASATASASLSPQEQAQREAALRTPTPQRPAGMDQNTPEAAIMAATYFLNLVPYMYATGDLEPWQAMSDPTCRFCNDAIDKVTEVHAAGGWADPWQQEVTATEWGSAPADPNLWFVSFTISLPERTGHDGSGGTVTSDPEEATFLVQLRWNGQEWIIEQGEQS